MQTEQHIARIKTAVEEYYDQHAEHCGVGYRGPDERQHIIEIGTSILCTKWKVGPAGGSFVQAVVNNDLMGAFNWADSINQKVLRFYCSLIYNQGYIA